MRILVDTQCWIWWVGDRVRLNQDAASLLSSLDHDCFLSVASSWEMAIKVGIGKLKLPLPVQEYIPLRCAETAMHELPITAAHALAVASLRHHHRDPFDRLLVAQAQVEGLTLLTSDTALKAYGVPIVIAGR